MSCMSKNSGVSGYQLIVERFLKKPHCFHYFWFKISFLLTKLYLIPITPVENSEFAYKLVINYNILRDGSIFELGKLFQTSIK